MLRDKRRGLKLEMPRQRADPDAVRRFVDKTEARDAIDVDENGGVQQAEIQHRHETLPTGENLGLPARSRQGRNRRVTISRDDIVELRRLHHSPGTV
jgi:predicted transcriptional regulator